MRATRTLIGCRSEPTPTVKTGIFASWASFDGRLGGDAGVLAAVAEHDDARDGERRSSWITCRRAWPSRVSVPEGWSTFSQSIFASAVGLRRPSAGVPFGRQPRRATDVARSAALPRRRELGQRDDTVRSGGRSAARRRRASCEAAGGSRSSPGPPPQLGRGSCRRAAPLRPTRRHRSAPCSSSCRPAPRPASFAPPLARSATAAGERGPAGRRRPASRIKASRIPTAARKLQPVAAVDGPDEQGQDEEEHGHAGPDGQDPVGWIGWMPFPTRTWYAGDGQRAARRRRASCGTSRWAEGRPGGRMVAGRPGQELFEDQQAPTRRANGR